MNGKFTKLFSSTCVTPAVLAVLFCAAAQAATPGAGNQSLALAWNPSMAAGVAGYHVYYGTKGTTFQHEINAGTNTSIEVPGLQAGQTNTFAVTAYNAQGVESTPSNLLIYIVPGLVKIAPSASDANSVVLSFPVAPGHTYLVQASPDLKTWSTLWATTPTNNAWTEFQDVADSNSRARYYRLAWQ